ncbi:MAG: ferrochelatase [Georgfuchsia sp.]
MNRYRKETAPGATIGADAVLLVNLGTPEAPTARALRPYLKQFLSDPRVVEIPRIVWWLILNGIILNTRPKKSAQKYAAIWTKDGSPLKVHTERQTQLLKGLLGESGNKDLLCVHAMRYGQPSIASALDRLKAIGAARIAVVPLYPQYAASATASVFDDVAAWMQNTRNVPQLRFVRSFPEHPGYIAALAASVREHWQMHGRGEKLVMSFHGIPKRSVDLGDPYQAECQATAKLLATELQLKEQQYVVSFQSRFGAATWLQPYTQPTLEQLAKEGVSQIDVICPGFAADCLETLEEIGMECKDAFLANGGKEFRYIPCLNERPDWIKALADIVTER